MIVWVNRLESNQVIDTMCEIRMQASATAHATQGVSSDHPRREVEDEMRGRCTVPVHRTASLGFR